jgi:diguanylate cyclase (GGDEF)-like protein
VLHCHNEECPVYQNPSLICYLETGSEAISPQWRDTCIFLNKYDTCMSCPVYELRSGDELSEMRNVVNTMMRLWANFLSRVGHLMAYVLRSQEQSGNVPSLDEISSRLEQMAKLTFFSHDLQGVLNKDEVFKQFSFMAEDNLGLNRFVLYEVDQDTDRMMMSVDKVPDQPLCKQMVLMSTEVCRAKRLAEDVYSFYNPVLCPHFNCDHSQDVRCCMPIVTGGQVGAVFSFLYPKREWENLRRQLPIVRKYLDETAPVLSSLRLLAMSKEQALRDPLTQCNNRRFLDEFITKYEPLSEREGKRTGFLMADVDYFKRVNDEHGHEAGDAVLQQVAAIIQTSIRRSDLLIRYGGEEFLVLLQNIQNGHSMEVADKIRTAIEQHDFELPDGEKIHKTISVGVAEYPEDAGALYKTIKFADVALYAAKHAGRNKIMRFTEDMWQEEDY